MWIERRKEVLFCIMGGVLYIYPSIKIFQMKNRIIRRFFLLILVLTGAISVKAQTESTFRFAFLTDIHLQPERHACEGFSSAIGKVNEMKPDFVITGGDLIMDALGVSQRRADSLYTLFLKQCQAFKMPIYHAIGNHEVFGWSKRRGQSAMHPESGKKMFTNRIDRPFRSMDYLNWHFIFLDATHANDTLSYHGQIDQEQLKWLKDDLASMGDEKFVAVITHIPILSAGVQYFIGNTKPIHPAELIMNNTEVLDVLKPYHLKLVLQGHLHYYEKTEIDGVSFVTGGAVSGRWWTGPNQGTEEGFVFISVQGDELQIQYVDYGWTPIKTNERE